MKHLNFPVLLSLFGLIIGIVLTPYFKGSLGSYLSILTLVLLGLITLHFTTSKRLFFKWLFGVFTVLFFTVFGIFLHKNTLPKNTANHYYPLNNNLPHTVFIEIKEALKPTSYQDKYLAKVIAIDGKNKTGLLLVNIDKDSLTPKPLSVGSRFFTRGIITKVPSPKNPYQFDYGNYLKQKRIYGQLSIANNELLAANSKANGVRVWAVRFRESIQKKLQTHAFTLNQLAIINALILGQRQGIEKEINQQYAAAGMMHILAVSGLHVGIILLLLRFITRPINRYAWRFARSGIIISLIWVFAILTGLSPSVLRAATMFSFLEVSTLVDSKKESNNALIVSALVLLLFNPLFIYQVGFQLSYLAVFAILWIQPWLSGLLNIKNRLLKKLWDTATVTTSAQLGVFPLSLFYFHQFPGLFLLSNIVIIPLLGIILSIGIIVVALAGLELLPEVLVTSFGLIIDTLNRFIAWVASLEAFVIKHISISLVVMISIYILIISVISLLKKQNYHRLVIALLSILIFSSILSWEKATPDVSELIIFHKSKQTLLGISNNNKLYLKTEDSLWDYTKDSRIQAYRNKRTINHIEVSKIPNIISLKKKRILVIDSLGVYTIKNFIPEYILLTQSPNINLERLIKQYPKTSIIADGNNYKSDIKRWKKTCSKQKIPFHSTYEKGAFIIKQ